MVQVEFGLYNCASEVIREAWRLMYARDEAEKAHYAEFRHEVLRGYEEARRGEFAILSLDEIEQATEARHPG